MSTLTLNQTKHTVDTSKVFIYNDHQEVYKAFLDSEPKKTWIVSKNAFDKYGRDVIIYYANYTIKAKLTCKN